MSKEIELFELLPPEPVFERGPSNLVKQNQYDQHPEPQGINGVHLKFALEHQ